MLPLNDEQSVAVDAILDFLADPDARFFRLAGYAGTGKTFCMQHLVDRVRGRMIFTAPTNKATKVLRDTMTRDDYKPECRTIYSLLGLRMEANGEVKELAVPEDPVDLTQYRAVVVDEGSMVNSQLFAHIAEVAEVQKLKFIFMGDAAQLPPVGELRSPIWTQDWPCATLERIMRYDNQILSFVTGVRKVVDHPAPPFKRANDNADGEGVWDLAKPAFMSRVEGAAAAGRFSSPNEAKAIAWRNVTVDELNAAIRRKIYGDAAATPWLPDDRLIVTSPAKNLSDELIASTDDEGRVTRVDVDWHPLWPEFKIRRIAVTLDDNRPITLLALHEDSAADHASRIADLAERARADRRRWKDYWKFLEDFHKVRHAYAITAHRAQGSTYTAAFVDWRDILLNRNRGEAFRCLYVACSRPRKELYLG